MQVSSDLYQKVGRMLLSIGSLRISLDDNEKLQIGRALRSVGEAIEVGYAGYMKRNEPDPLNLLRAQNRKRSDGH